MLLGVEVHQQGARTSLPFPPEAVGAFSCRGVTVNPRSGRAIAKVNQDRGCVCACFAGDPKRALVCVFDGHGSKGELVSQYVLDHLPPHLVHAQTNSLDLPLPVPLEPYLLPYPYAYPVPGEAPGARDGPGRGVALELRGDRRGAQGGQEHLDQVQRHHRHRLPLRAGRRGHWLGLGLG